MTHAHRPSNCISHRQSRSGVILLVVLGMLTLFSVLGVSYLVFTSRQRASAISISKSETAKIDTKILVERSLEKVLVGSDGPESSMWGQDVIGDLYGSRDAVEGSVPLSNAYEGASIDSAPEVLMGNQFLRFPTNLHVSASYPYRRNDNQVERRYPGYPGGFSNTPPTTRFPVDGMLSGRLLTFYDGPLENLTFEIVRSFGDHRNSTPRGRETLSGQLVIDLRPHLNASVEVDGESKTIQEWLDAGLSPHRFIYQDVVTSNQIGPAANVASPLPYGDFYINGRILNGTGLGWDVARTNVSTTSGTTFNLNEVVSTELNVTVLKDRPGSFTPTNEDLPFRNSPYDTNVAGVDIPVAFQGHYALHRLSPNFAVQNQLQSFITDLPPGDVDEPYDAADYNNLWLSYFPSSLNPNDPNDPLLGEPTPSFVRPAILNWIVNQQNGGTLQSQTPQRLRNVLYAIQRSTMRPLPFENDPKIPASISNRSPGILQLSYANFTGGNTSDGLLQPIDLSSNDPVYLSGRILSLARSLAGRDTDGDGQIDSWDVDNDGDGFVDSIWMDAGLPIQEDPTGRQFKPLVAYMIEDLGGRVNVNRAGNLTQARRNLFNTTISGATQHDSPVLSPISSPTVSPVTFSENNAPTGFGFGPAEIDLRALFLPTNHNSTSTTIPTTFFTSSDPDTRLRFGVQRLLGDRLGTWSLNTNNAGNVPSTSVLTNANGRMYIAAGELQDPLTSRGNDWRGAIRDPLRTNLHDHRESQGIPLDTFGRMTIGVDLSGALAIGRGSSSVAFAGDTAGDVDNDPYEFQADANADPDEPFRYGELEALLRFDGFDRDLASSRLMELIDGYHSQPTAGRAQLDQATEFKRILADSMTTHSNSVATATGVLPSEWRGVATTISDLRTGVATIAANAALPAQHMFFESLSSTALASVGATARDHVRNAWLWELLPPELRDGGRMNLNRPFGNGVNDDDDDRDGQIGTYVDNPGPGSNTDGAPYRDVIDDPEEVGVGEVHLRYDSTLGPANTLWSSSRGDVTPGEPGLNSRATFARHLYVLAMFLTRDSSTGADYVFPFNPAIPFTQLAANPVPVATEYRAWKIAQWAVNVADFRDPDAIMTRFDYDPNPYDGWDVVNAAGGPTYRTVWGLEYPELTLEESFAFHDRRVRDTDREIPTASRDGSVGRVITNTNSAGGDNDADQYQIPIGSAFFEIRNTRSPQPYRSSAADTDTHVNPMSFPPELYKNRNTVNPNNPGFNNSPTWMLDLGAEAPDANPVWRIAITQFHDATNRPTSCPDFLLQPTGADQPANTFSGPGMPAVDRDTVTLDPERPQFFGPTVPTPIDRVVWFTSRNPDADDDGIVDGTVQISPTVTVTRRVPNDSFAAGKVFYNRSANRFLAPGQIAAIGPRADTALGTAHYSDGPDANPVNNLVIDPEGVPLLPPERFSARQRVRMTNGVEIHDFTGTNVAPRFDGVGAPVGGASARSVLNIVAQSNPPTQWSGTNTVNRTIGLNISEPYEVTSAAASAYPATATPPLTPRSYYAEPTQQLSNMTSPGFQYAWDTWHNFDTDTGNLPDTPLDSIAGAELFDTLGLAGQQTGTREHYKTAYLQRLADPTQPFHPQTNPYISVDYISIDLTVFNGSQDNSASVTDAMGNTLWPDPVDPSPFTTAPAEKLASRYKTGMPVDLPVTSPNGFSNLTFSVNTFAPAVTASVPAGPLPPPGLTHLSFFRVPINVTPNVNTAADIVAASPLRQTHNTSLGWSNQTYGRRWQQSGAGDITMTPYTGLPFETWLSNVTWLNRSFASPDELMWVPTSGPGRLCFEFGNASVANGLPVGTDPFTDANNELPVPARRYDFNQRFTHLFNYLSNNNNVFAAAGGAGRSPNFWRLLDWIEVPPPFDVDADFITPEGDLLTVGENSLVAPSFNYSTFYDQSAANAFIDANPMSWNLAWPGTNRDRTYSNGVWTPTTNGTGLTNGFWTNDVSMEAFRPPFSFQSKTYREGLVNLNTIKNERVYRALMYGFSTDAERLAQGAFWGPLLDSRRGYTLPVPAAPVAALRPNLNHNFPTQIAGVFKPSNSSDIEPQISSSVPRNPIDSTFLRQALGGGAQLLKRGGSLSNTQSQDRSVVHNQLGVTRLANLASEQSNVFAVWVTVGLFEIDGSTLTVGQELGSDTGEVTRAKGFFIIDRSVPVMYRPGELNNVMNVVQLSRIVD